MKQDFRFSYLNQFFHEAKKLGYSFFTLKDFFEKKTEASEKTIVLRVDVDFDPLRVKDISEILKSLSITGTFFFRLHGKYNLFSFPVVNIIKNLISSGHEIGIHSELIDMEKICSYNPEKLLRTNIMMMEKMFDTKIYGTACHSDHTTHNNLDFWNNKNAANYDLLYEAYDDLLFKKEYYVSDSQVSRWKKYYKGTLDEAGPNDPLTLIRTKEVAFMCLLIHPDSFYSEHYHENIKY